MCWEVGYMYICNSSFGIFKYDMYSYKIKVLMLSLIYILYYGSISKYNIAEGWEKFKTKFIFEQVFEKKNWEENLAL